MVSLIATERGTSSEQGQIPLGVFIKGVSVYDLLEHPKQHNRGTTDWLRQSQHGIPDH